MFTFFFIIITLTKSNSYISFKHLLSLCLYQIKDTRQDMYNNSKCNKNLTIVVNIHKLCIKKIQERRRNAYNNVSSRPHSFFVFPTYLNIYSSIFYMSMDGDQIRLSLFKSFKDLFNFVKIYTGFCALQVLLTL